MKISECPEGAVVRVPGIGLELEVLAIHSSSVLVRPMRNSRRTFTNADGDSVAFTCRPDPFTVSLETIVERGP